MVFYWYSNFTLRLCWCVYESNNNDIISPYLTTSQDQKIFYIYQTLRPAGLGGAAGHETDIIYTCTVSILQSSSSNKYNKHCLLLCLSFVQAQVM